MDESECRACRLHATRTHVVVGRGPRSAQVMIIGEAPGRDEDRTGLGFQGAAGRVFEDILAFLGLRRGEIWLANAVRCRPSVDGKRNRAPRPDEIAACRQWLERDLGEVQPKAVVTLGRVAFESVIGRPWDTHQRVEPVPISHATQVFGLYHPAYLIYRRNLQSAYRDDLGSLRERLVALNIPLAPPTGPWTNADAPEGGR